MIISLGSGELKIYHLSLSKLYCRGVSTDEWQEWEIPRSRNFDINPGVINSPGFGTFDSLCQNLIISQEIRYNKYRPNDCQHYEATQVKQI